MIWISTICLLAIAAWLFFNALNERRWVEAHSHDESVASDKGFLPSFTSRTGSGLLGDQEKVSIHQENSRFARAVSMVQEKSAKMSDKFIESRAAAARIDDESERPRSAREEDTMFGRAVALIGEKTERMDQKLDDKMKAASSQTAKNDDGSASDESLFARTTKQVAAKSDEISTMVANRAKGVAQKYESATANAGENTLFSKVMTKVSSGMETIEAKIDSRASKAKEESGEDLMTRVASKIGSRINEIDEKVVETSKEAISKTDKV